MRDTPSEPIMTTDAAIHTEEIVRELIGATPGIPASDGAGVRLTRIIGSPQLNMIDPLLLLDCFESDDPNDYIGGFPAHPHRGFETVTYLLAGRLRHKDNTGREGGIEPGGVQWMTAARGIVHSEMPEQDDGLLRGFQLWINLPAAEKMTAPGYQEFNAVQIPTETRADGAVVRVVAGTTDSGSVGPAVRPSTDPYYLDVELPAQTHFEQHVPHGHAAVVLSIDGALAIGTQAKSLPQRHLGVLGAGTKITLKSDAAPARFLLIAARPLNEPVARHGPFVMNTQAEIVQAFQDYQNNRF
jgi:redox-sensitive bicupin YhaK (pirin superfamily)